MLVISINYIFVIGILLSVVIIASVIQYITFLEQTIHKLQKKPKGSPKIDKKPEPVAKHEDCEKPDTPPTIIHIHFDTAQLNKITDDEDQVPAV
jgi:predicted RND superfamily exporter protein